MEDLESFRKHSGIHDADLPLPPTRPDKNDNIPFRQYQFYLGMYNNHMEINCAAVAFLRKLCPSRLVGLEVGYNQLPTNLMVGTAHKYLVTMIVEPNIDTEAAIKLQLAGHNMTYTPNAKGPTVFFQKVEHIQFQLTQTDADDILNWLELSNNVIKTIALLAFRKCGRLQQNIEFIKPGWKKADIKFISTQLDAVIKATSYTRFKDHWIKELSRIYKGGDK